MHISYDMVYADFLSKISEYSFLSIPEEDRTEMLFGFMKRALVQFKKNCKYDLISSMDDEQKVFNIEVSEDDADDLIDIISEGMIVQWLKPYYYRQELLESVLNTKDFTSYSPAELLLRVGDAYRGAQKTFTQRIREYSYNNGRLSDLHI